ncbi:MAG: hypothetical protein NVV72_11380 [Asticcacaulis sp.]|nr:hypothetical protein [Asticcacaulis sp.]
MLGQGTLAELRESLLAAEAELSGGASPRVAPFADVRDAGALLQRAGFALPVADVETGDGALRYDVRPDARPARHGRHQPARGVRTLAAAGDPEFFARAAEIYAERFSGPGRAHPGDLLVHLDVGLDAGRLAAEAAEARLGGSVAGQGAGAERKRLISC